MSLEQFANNASTTLASAITNTGTTVTVAAGGGSLFPALTGAEYFWATIVKNGASNTYEIVKVTARSGDTMTIVRSQQGTTAPGAGWAAGDFFNQFVTAGGMTAFAQTDDLQAQSTNYVADTGTTANSYVAAIQPALAAHVVGMPIRWKATHACTGAACTFSDGFGSSSLVTPEGSPPALGTIVSGGVYESIWDGSKFQLVNVHTTSFSELSGSVAAGQVPVTAVTQYQAALAIATTQLKGTVSNAQVPQSAVTQYQAALAIAWTQITGTKNADQLQGKTIATAATANSIAGRDASGDITTKNFISTAAPDAVTPSYVWGDTGNGEEQRIPIANFLSAIITSTLATNGAIVFPGGGILQWGSITKQASAQATVNFTKPFQSACYNVQITDTGGGSSNGANGYVQRILNGSVTTGGFQIVTDVFDGQNANITVYWWAVGK